MSQETFAAHIGVTFQQVSKYEKGVNSIGASRLHQITVALGVSVSSLFSFDGNALVCDQLGSADPILSKDAADLNKAFLKTGDVAVRKSLVDRATSLGKAA